MRALTLLAILLGGNLLFNSAGGAVYDWAGKKGSDAAEWSRSTQLGDCSQRRRRSQVRNVSRATIATI